MGLTTLEIEALGLSLDPLRRELKPLPMITASVALMMTAPYDR
jgi:hypothetical protein